MRRGKKSQTMVILDKKKQQHEKVQNEQKNNEIQGRSEKRVRSCV